LINNYLGQLATAAGTEATKERRALYCRALKDIGESQLKYAFEQALRNLGQFLPSIEQIRAYSEQWKPVDPIAETRKVLTREDKPPDWQLLGQRAGVTPEDARRWLEEGKAKQRAHIATLEADPEWRKLAANVGVPQYRDLAARENGGLLPSTIPKTPDERKPWARQKAIDQGWIEKPVEAEPEPAWVREPGEEG
jgi:hypothetical protein